eukprot:m.214047 g.214047  ORF g.214047 m.214047 type:complete len:376 (+) comp39804_c0_seq32:189-1316(+)
MALSKDSSSLSVRNELLWWSSLLRPHLCRRYLEAGADPSSNLGGLTALHIAAKRNLPHMVDTLSNFRAPVDARDRFGLTPLFWAASSGQDCVRFLLEGGADIGRVSPWDFTNKVVKEWICSHRKGRISIVKLFWDVVIDENSCERLSTDFVQEEVQFWLDFCLWWSTSINNPCTILLERGANPNSTIFIRSPLHWAASYGNAEILKLFLHIDSVQVDQVDCLGWTALQYAATKENIPCAEMLLRQGADPFHVNIDGSPLDIAREKQNPELIHLFVCSVWKRPLFESFRLIGVDLNEDEHCAVKKCSSCEKVAHKLLTAVNALQTEAEKLHTKMSSSELLEEMKKENFLRSLAMPEEKVTKASEVQNLLEDVGNIL